MHKNSSCSLYALDSEVFLSEWCVNIEINNSENVRWIRIALIIKDEYVL